MQLQLRVSNEESIIHPYTPKANINISITGVQSVTTDSSNIVISGNVGRLTTHSGNIKVDGNVGTLRGDNVTF